jgi:asparagine synthase (glutamine-hydrolysing)
MCAIAGVVDSNGRAKPYIRGMADLMRHRGPDDQGFLFRGPHGIELAAEGDFPAAARQVTTLNPAHREKKDDCWLALGHRRLSILDLSPLGHQPMSYQDRYWIVYNGEVYNYLELRIELEKAGHQFRSHCDTEVILAAYAQWGSDCFARFNGMWALAIYDAHTDLLLLSRDRFGVKPLYYWQDGEQFAFASEIKAFTCLPGWRPRVNGQAVHDFLLSGLQDHSSETMFANVFQLEPGSFARLDCKNWNPSANSSPKRRLEISKWYQIRPQPFSGNAQEAAQRFRDLLFDSVRLRLRSDVPVGSCLSGGLDSSSIVCTTHALLSSTESRCAHKTFSACSEMARFDEREYIKQVVRSTGVESHYVFPSRQDLLTELEQLTWHQDEPFAGTSIYAQWCVFRSAAAANIKVMLDGQGADELLCGYNDFRRAFLCGLVRSGKLLTAWREARVARGSFSRALTAIGRAAMDSAIPLSAQTLFRGVKGNRHPASWLDRGALTASFPGRLAGRFHKHRSAREMSIELLTGAHLQMLLHWEDRNSMAHSLESRVPFLDYRLVEFVTGLPDDYKIHHGVTKAVLRDGMRDLVPATVLQRRDKMGFVTPEEVWAKENDGESFQRLFTRAVEDCRGVIAPNHLSVLEASLSGATRYDSAIWRIISLGTWMRLFKVAP